MPIRILSNEFWGKKYGSVRSFAPKNANYIWGPVFEVPRGSKTSRAGGSHQGPTGKRKSRFYAGRRFKKGLGK